MQRITDTWRSVYFTEPILLNVILFTLVVSIIKRENLPSFRWLPLYLSMFLVQFIADYLYTYFLFPKHQQQFLELQREINFYITIIEMLVFLSFFRSVLRILIFRRILKWLCIISLLLFIYLYVKTHAGNGYITHGPLNKVYIIELATLLCASVFYFIQLFREPPVSNLRNVPGFWIVSGLSFYCLGTLPLTVANSYFFSNGRSLIYVNLYTIIYVFYVLLFVLIIRSFLCKPLRTT